MYKFLIETVNNEIVYDFTFHLKEAVRYNNWFYNEELYDYELADEFYLNQYKDCIPVGSIEFVLDFYREIYDIKDIKPINIPQELNKWKYLKRYITTADNKDKIIAYDTDKFFVKDISGFKKIMIL